MANKVKGDSLPDTNHKIQNKVIVRKSRKSERERLRRARIKKSMDQLTEFFRPVMPKHSTFDQLTVVQMTEHYLREMPRLTDALKTAFNQRAAHALIARDTMEFFDANPQYDKAIRDSVMEKLNERVKLMDREIEVLSATIRSWDVVQVHRAEVEENPNLQNCITEYFRPWQ